MTVWGGYAFSRKVDCRLFVTTLGWRRRGSPATHKHEHGGVGRKDADIQRRVGCSGVGVRGDRTPYLTYD